MPQVSVTKRASRSAKLVTQSLRTQVTTLGTTLGLFWMT